jgi:hypothetical protein
VDFIQQNSAAPLPPGYPKLDWKNAGDGRQRMQIFRPFPVFSEQTGDWEIRSRILGMYDKGAGKGTVMERMHDMVDAITNEVYVRSWESCYFVAYCGWGGDKDTSPSTDLDTTKRYKEVRFIVRVGETILLSDG